jgi:hypothetical protein
MIDIADGGALSIMATFVVNVKGVSPALALQNAADSLNATLQSVGLEFQGVANGFVDGFSNAADFLAQITETNRLTLALDAAIDVTVAIALSTSGFAVSSELRALSSALSVRVEESFETNVGGFAVAVAPAIELILTAENTAVPFDLFEGSGLATFDFGGSLDCRVVVTVEGVPAAVTFEAAVPDITNATATVDFDVFVDIDLYPIREST